MSARPTIEERMACASFAPPPGDTLAIDPDDAAAIAREYAAERTEPLVDVLTVLLARRFGWVESEKGVAECQFCGEPVGMEPLNCTARIARLAIAAEKEARQ